MGFSRNAVVNQNTLLLSFIVLYAIVACSGGAENVFETDSTTTTGSSGPAPVVGTSGSGGQGPTGSVTAGPTGSGSSGTTSSSSGGGSPIASATGAGGSGRGGGAGIGGAAGSTGGAGVMDSGVSDAAHSACDGKTRKVTIADPFLADFESGDLHGWYDFGAAGTLNLLVVGVPGALATARAGHLAATALTSFGAGMGLATGCLDVSSLGGVSFWAKGSAGSDNVVQFQLAIPTTHGADFGGDCFAKCNDHPSKKVTLTPDWKQYAVAFGDLAQAGFGAPAKYAGIIMALNWVSMSGPAVNFWVDEVALYSGTPSLQPVGRGRPDAN